MLHILTNIFIWISYVIIGIYCVLSTLIGTFIFMFSKVQYQEIAESQGTLFENVQMFLMACALPTMVLLGRFFAIAFDNVTEDSCALVSIGFFLFTWVIFLIASGYLGISTISNLIQWMFQSGQK